jgi:hypothetical protein
MKTFNPTAPARDVIAAGLVIEDLHSSLYSNLAGRADLEPGSQQLIVGGIGSGKTTELLLAERWIRSQPKALCLYIDVTAETDLARLNSGALLASFGIHLDRECRSFPESLSGDLKKNLDAIREFAYGKTVQVWVDESEEEPDYDDDPGGYYATRKVPGKLLPPLPALQREIQDITGTIDFLIELTRQKYDDVIVIFDGLDRLVTPEKFLSVVHQDFRAFRAFRVSVLATAPVAIYGVWQTVAERFDRVQPLPVIASDPIHSGFLQSLLARRGAYELMSQAEAETLCTFSGGVLRDLITLARDAAEEAYISGAERISRENVEKVISQLGLAYLRGLGPLQLHSLRQLRATKSFNLQNADNMELLVTRRVLEYSPTDFRVHPALVPFLTGVDKPDA